MYSLFTIDKNYLYIKYFFFLIFLFPFLMHIYWGIFDIFYANNILYIALFLLLGILFFNYIEKKFFIIKNKPLFYILFIFLFIFLLNSYMLGNYKEFIKYFVYITIFYFLFSRYLHENYFILFINIVTVFIVINLFLYFYCLIFPLSSYFIAEKLSLLTADNSFIMRQDWEYAIPFYLIVFPLNVFGDDQTGLLGLPRLFGMSTEPSLYSVVVLPTAVMALYFKKNTHTFFLFIALLLASSYGALVIGFIGILFYIFYRYKMFIFILLTALFFLGYLSGFYQQLASYSPRLELYMGLVLNIFDLSSITLFANHNSDNVDKLKVLSALLSQTLKYGLLQGISYLMIFFIYIKLSLKTNNKLIFVFAIVSLLIVNKSGEILSPLFLFYLSFVYSQYLILNKKLDNIL